MKQRILYAIGQLLLVVACSLLIPAGAVLVLRLSGEHKPEMFGWYGLLILAAIYAPMSASVSALVLGIDACLRRTRTTGQAVMAVLVGILHGFVFLFVALSFQVMLAGAVAVSGFVLASCVVHTIRRKQNEVPEDTASTVADPQQ